MSDLSANPTKIQVEATSYRAAVSESLMQTMGGSINYCLANLLPVASIIPSMLDEATFQLQTSANWILCDGRSVAGSQYEALTGNSTVPDARGIFLRGKNNGRVDGKENPSGDVALGTYQADDNKPHSHGGVTNSNTHAHTYEMYNNFGSGGGAKGSDGTGGSQGQGTTNDNTHSHGINSDGVEGRPKNITVNYFVRID